MIKNINFNKDRITTILGITFIVVSLLLVIVPLFVVVKTSIDVYLIYSIGVVGLGLLLAPDSVLGAIKTLLNNRSKNI